MDISSPCGKSVLENVDSFGGLQCSANQKRSPSCSLTRDLVNDLGNALGESLSIKDDGEVGHTSNGDNISGVEKRNACKGLGGQHEKATQKCLNKCEAFPYSNVVLPPIASSDVEEEEPETALVWLFGEEHFHQAYSRSVTLPAPLKLLSAMKGSRKKEGLSPGKFNVTWAPDVYDPPATSMSHTVRGKKQQKSKNKKNWKKDGKKGQKGNSSRGSTGKDKKQIRRVGASERTHKSLDAREILVDTNDGFGELVVGSPDPRSYCGSSFLKKSLTNMHYPVAEAL